MRSAPSEPRTARRAARSMAPGPPSVARTGAGRPSPDAPETAPLVEALLVDESELLDDAARGPVVGADADVDVAKPRNGAGVTDHPGERRGVHAAPAKARVRVEAVEDRRARRRGPRPVDVVHERVLLAVDEP